MIARLTYALKNNVLTSIEDVERGKSCGCICPYCKKPLIAKKGDINEHHFAHQSIDSCEYGYQTSVHCMAKEIFSEMECYKLPPIECNTHYGKVTLYKDGFNVKIDRVYLECNLGSVIPDVVIESGGKKLFVEIYVTHKVDEEKHKKLKELGVSTIEIDLSKVHYLITKDELRKVLINGSQAYWIYNAYVPKYQKLLKNVIERHIVEIPIIKLYGEIYMIANCPRRNDFSKSRLIYGMYRNPLRITVLERCKMWCIYHRGATSKSVKCLAEFDLNRIDDVKYIYYKARDTLVQDYSKNYGIITMSKQFLESIIGDEIPVFELVLWYIADYVHIKSFSENSVTVDFKSEKHRLFFECCMAEFNSQVEACDLLLTLNEEDAIWQTHKRGCHKLYNTWSLSKIVQQVRNAPQKINTLKLLSNG